MPRACLFGSQWRRYAGFITFRAGYFRKGFDKHGPLSNLMPSAISAREAPERPAFTHTFLVTTPTPFPSFTGASCSAFRALLSHVVLSEMTPTDRTIGPRTSHRSPRPTLSSP